jgi:hypothetical protein
MVSEELQARIVGLYKGGMDIDRIANEVHITRRSVERALFRAGLRHHPDQRRYRSLSRGEVSAIPSLIVAGYRQVPEFTPESVERDYLNGLLPFVMAIKYNVPRNEVMKLLVVLIDRQRTEARLAARREAWALKKRG